MPTDQPSRSSQRMLLLLCLGTGLTAASLYVYLSILSPYAAHLGASLVLVGLIGGSYGFVQLFTRIPMGMLSDQGFGRLIIRSSPVLAGLACLGLGLLRQPESFVAWRALAGLGGSALVAFPLAFAHILGPNRITRATGLFTFSFGLGQTASTLLGGGLAQGFGWQAPFFAGLLLAVGALLALSPASKPLRHSGQLTLPNAGQFLITARNRQVLLAVGLGVIGNLAHVTTVFTFVPLKAVELGASRSELGILVAASMGALTAGNLMCGTLLTKWLSRRWIAALGLGLLGLGTVGLVGIDQLSLLYVTQVTAGFGWGLGIPALMATALDAAGSAQYGSASALFQWGASWGTFGGPVIGGLIAQHLSLNMTFLFCGTLCLLATLFLFWKPLGE
jgi:MFS family permease